MKSADLSEFEGEFEVMEGHELTTFWQIRKNWSIDQKNKAEEIVKNLKILCRSSPEDN